MNAQANAVRVSQPLLLAEAANPQAGAKNWPHAPAMIEEHPHGLTAHPTLASVARRFAEKLAGRPFVLDRGFAGYGDFDPFPKVTVWADRVGGDWLGLAVLLGDPHADARRLSEAITDAQAAQTAA
jgi:hypothetical protein